MSTPLETLFRKVCLLGLGGTPCGCDRHLYLRVRKGLALTRGGEDSYISAAELVSALSSDGSLACSEKQVVRAFGLSHSDISYIQEALTDLGLL